MIGTFNSVGQGAFYTEELYCDNTNIFTMVYDCGSYTSVDKHHLKYKGL